MMKRLAGATVVATALTFGGATAPAAAVPIKANPIAAEHAVKAEPVHYRRWHHGWHRRCHWRRVCWHNRWGHRRCAVRRVCRPYWY